MYSSIGTKKYGAMTDDQFKQLLETMTAGLDPFKTEVTFAITTGQANIEKLIDYSTSKGIKL